MKTIPLWVALLIIPPMAGAGWFLNQEQQAEEDYNEGHYEEAARGFEDPYRRGVANYRTGDYQAASDDFSRVEREEVRQDALYNLGNARYKLEDYPGAILAYETVLENNPDHTDARHNLALAKEKLAQRQTEEEQEEEEKEQQENESSEQQEQQDQQSGEQQEEQQQSDDQQQEEQQSGEQQQDEQQQSGEQQQDEQQQSGEQQQDEQQQSGEQQQDEQQQSGEQQQDE
ncbi:MAG: tetratricopeptide repeat protein, partial [Candidatus Thiodiazotropha sp.]